MIRRLLGGAAAAALVLSTGLAIAPAAEAKTRCGRNQATAAQYPPASCKASVSRTSVPRGGKVRIAGSGFRRGETVRVELAGRGLLVLKRVKAGRNGAVAVTVTIPRDLRPGTYTLSLHGLRSGEFRSARIRVLAAQARVASGRSTGGAVAATGGSSGGSLPMTGTELAGLTGVGGAAVLGGAGLVLAGRRRRSAAASV